MRTGGSIQPAPRASVLRYGFDARRRCARGRYANGLRRLALHGGACRAADSDDSARWSGKINVYNILAACCAALSYGLDWDDDCARHRRVPARCRAASNAWTKDSLPGGGGLRPHRRCAAQRDRGGARACAQARHHAVRLRRRPRPHQASADGGGGRRGQRFRGADIGQSALGRSASRS